MGLTRFPGRKLVVALLYTGMGFPPVVIGLFVYLLLSRSGPLGSLGSGWMPAAVHPGGHDRRADDHLLPAGGRLHHGGGDGRGPCPAPAGAGSGRHAPPGSLTMLSEARVGVVVSIIAGFGSIISEVGAVMLVGGNIEGRTRVLTTAIVLETRKGNFDLALALGGVLLAHDLRGQPGHAAPAGKGFRPMSA